MATITASAQHRPSLRDHAPAVLFARGAVLFALFLVCMFACFAAPSRAYALDVTTIDISGKGANTTIKITEPGAYRLMGSSSKAWIDVKVGNVDLYLADGLNITPGISANTGASCPSIKIEEAGGTVNIISESGAS